MKSVISKKIMLASGLLLVLNACDTTEQDKPSSTSSFKVTGAMVDPYILGGIVYADMNNNKTLDAFEPYALTDIDGFFGVSTTGVNYCDTGPTIHCLDAPYSLEGQVVRMTDGIDVSTGETFEGTLTAVVTNGQAIATPITSVIMHLSNADAFLNANNITTTPDLFDPQGDFLDLVDADPNTADDIDIDTTILTSVQNTLKLAITLQNVVEVTDASFQETNSNKVDFPGDISDRIYAKLASNLSTAGPAAGQMNAAFFTNVITDTKNALETELGSTVTSPASPSLEDRLVNLAGFIDNKTFINTEGTGQPYGFNQVARMTDIMAKMMSKPTYDPASFTKANTFFGTNAADLTPTADLYGLMSNFEDPTVLVGQVTTPPDLIPIEPTELDVEPIENVVTDSQGNQFTNSANLDFISDDPNNPDATTGTVTMEIIYTDVDGDMGLDLGDTTTGTPETLTGDYTLLENGSMLMDFDIAGTTQTVIMKEIVDPDDPTQTTTIYLFDIGGELVEWNASTP